MAHEMNTQSPEIKNIIAALCKFQGECGEAQKSQTNSHFKSKYASHSDVMKAIKKPLAENGLSISQHPTLVENTIFLTTYLYHTSGEWLSNVTPCKPKDLGPQTVGSVLTYLRRYGINAILNIATGEDDDGQTAEGQDPLTKAEALIEQYQDHVKNLEESLRDLQEKNENYTKTITKNKGTIDTFIKEYPQEYQALVKKYTPKEAQNV